MVQVRFMQASYFWNGARFLPLDKLFFSAQFLLSLLKNMPHIPTYDRTNITTLTWNRLNNNELIWLKAKYIRLNIVDRMSLVLFV